MNFKGNILLGHTRQGSVGYKKTVDEAHPFLINDDLIFSHNGTIKNVKELCTKYEFEEKDFNVDSKFLGTMLYIHGIEALVNYKGAAALAYTYLSEPETLYLFHGTSRDYKNGPLLEERPLYFMETKDGIYYSSLENSLKAIREFENEEVLNLEYNVIFKIKNGEFLLEDSVIIERENTNVTIYIEPKTNNNFSKSNYNHNYDYNTRNTKDMRMIHKESYPKKLIDSAKDDFKILGNNFIYYHCGRYWEAPKKLLTGPIYVKKGGIISNYEDKSSELLFFYNGVLLKDKEAFYEIKYLSQQIHSKNWVTNPELNNFPLEISKYSQYPVTFLPIENNTSMSEYYRSLWYKNKSEKESPSFTPKYSGRCYEIKDGILISIKSSQRETCVLDTSWDVEQQYLKLKKVDRIPGGSSALLLPFQKKEEKKLLWFFEETIKDENHLKEVCGEQEFEALRRFIRYAYIRDFSIVPSDREIEEYMDNIIDSSIKKECSIGQFLDSEIKDDSEKLLDFYNKVIENKSETIDFTSISNKIDDNCENSLITSTLEDEEDEEDKEESLDDIVESTVIDLENIQSSAFELVIEENSDYAQDISNVLLIGVDNMLSNLYQSLGKYNKKSLEERIKKIRETKIGKNDIL